MTGQNYSDIINCYNIGEVIGDGDYIGGISGENNHPITSCYNIGNVSGNNAVGGVVGYNYFRLENSYNTGTVTGNTDIGGVTGQNDSHIENCYSTGAVSGNENVGGVVGLNYTTKVSLPNITITNCYYLKTDDINSELDAVETNNNTAENTVLAYEKDLTAFECGEVAYLLQSANETQIWGQNLTSENEKDAIPVLTSENDKKVLKVTFATKTEPLYATAYTNPEKTVILPTPPDLGELEFKKWSVTNNSDGAEFTANTPITEDITVYAIGGEKEPGKTYSVTLETNGGTINSGNVETYTTGTAVTLPTNVTKSGYTFAGWFDNAKLTGSAMTEIPATAEGDKTFYAKWNKKTSSSNGGGSGGGGGGGGWKGSASVPSITPPDDSTQEPQVQPTDNAFWFVDVPENAWYYAPIKYVFDKELMLGTSETEFEPETNITRGMFVTILHRMENKPTASTPHTFEDVPTGEYYADAVAWASEQGIVEGYSSSEYAPDKTITREEMAAIIYRYAGFKGYDRSAQESLRYSDSNDISDYAKIPVIWNSAVGIMHGNEDGTFAPQGLASRAEAAAVFQRLAEYLK